MQKGAGGKFIKDLVTRDDKASATKIWMNVACAVATAVVIWYAWKLALTDWMFVLYLATVGGFDIIFKLISARYGAGTPPPAEPVPAPIPDYVPEEVPETPVTQKSKKPPVQEVEVEGG